MRESGLKLIAKLLLQLNIKSFSMRESGLKFLIHNQWADKARLSPCERVDWNGSKLNKHRLPLCLSPCERVDWNLKIGLVKPMLSSLSPCERVDWNIAGETGPELITFYIQGSELKILSLYYIDLFKVKLISIYKKVTLYTRSNILFIIILKEERKTKNGR